MNDNMMLAVMLSPVLLVLLVGISQWLDRRAIKRENRRSRRGRPLVPDFTQVRPR
jgi:hypothetical protein